MPLQQTTANREYKNNLFIYLFTKKKDYALSLYNAVNQSNYTNEEDLQFKVLEDVLFIEMKNDVSFIFDNTLNLYEHQSTFSNNMPLRGLFYLADLYRKLVPSDCLYRKKLIRIPTPKYIVFYNGPVEDMDVDRLELRLSDAFEVVDESKGFEWTATVLNINPGFNEKIFEKCGILREYTLFVEIVRKNAEIMHMNKAMVKAIEECLNEGVLVEFLQEYGKELEEMSWERYDTERILQIQHEEALEDAREEGIQQGIQQGIEQGIEQGRAEAERTIFLLKQEKDREITLLRQEIEKLKRKACTLGQSVLE